MQGFTPFVVFILAAVANLAILVAGDAEVFVKLETYSNPTGTDQHGRCCDGWPLVCRFGCDYYFKLCLDEPHESNRTKHCRYGNYRTDFDEAYRNKRDVVFGETIGGQSNPFIFIISGTINKMVTLKTEIKDYDHFRKNDYVDFLRKDLWLYKGIYEEVQIPLRLLGRTRLYATVTIKCAKNWYGEECGTFCAVPSETDHYRCSTSGLPTCDPGWKGPLCNHKK